MPTKKWWEDKKFPDLGCGVIFSADWAAGALAEEALKRDGTVFNGNLEGVLRGSFKDLVHAFEILGFRTVAEGGTWRGDTTGHIFMVQDDSMAALWNIDGDAEVRVVSLDEKIFKASQDVLELAIGPKASAGRVYVLISTPEGPDITSIGVASVPLERDNYNPEVLEDFDAVVADLKSGDPSGRLAIFDGIPGTGKTFMVRGLLSAVQNALFVLVPAGLVPELANPSMISALLETRRNKGDLPTVFLIEDADQCLGSRDDGNVNAVSALLNLGDGIIGSLMDLRLICTTNLKNEELDEAVTRPGRLSRKVHVGALDRAVAEKLYQKLTGKKVSIDEKLTLAQVYSLARDDGWKPVEKKRSMGFAAPKISPDVASMLKDLGLEPRDL